MIYINKYSSPLGEISMASDGENLVGLWLEGQRYFMDSIRGETTEDGDIKPFRETEAWLDRYFAGEKPAAAELPLAPAGSEFRQKVWAVLCEIPYGEVITYGDIAKRIAADEGREKMSARAVGGAVGHNPISVIIPCHRVIGANGKLTGYAGGIDKKIKLLRHEGVKKFKE